jgi:RHS repeat-associated protein
LTLTTGGSLSQAYDRAGNVISEGRSLTGPSGDNATGTAAYTYDRLSRLIGESGLSAGRSYTYDQDGNRATKVEGSTTFTSVYDRSDALVSVVKTGGSLQSFSYDAYGALTTNVELAVAGTGYTYDAAGRLTFIDAQGTTSDATFVIDALGRAKTRSISTSPTATLDTYGYLADTEVVSEIATTGGSTATTDAALGPDGSRLAVKTGSTLSWTLPDLHGDIAGLLASTPTTISDAYRYDGYGQTLGTPYGTAKNPWRYQGRLDVSPTGTPLYDLSARNYSPGLGTFTSVDSFAGSAANPLSLNRYLYALANPATLIDPTGHEVCHSSSDLCDENDAIRYGDSLTGQRATRRIRHRDRERSSGGNQSGGASGGSGSGGNSGGAQTPAQQNAPQAYNPFWIQSEISQGILEQGLSLGASAVAGTIASASCYGPWGHILEICPWADMAAAGESIARDPGRAGADALNALGDFASAGAVSLRDGDYRGFGRSSINTFAAVFAVGLGFRGLGLRAGGVVPEAAGESVSLFRFVSKAELDDIVSSSGQFRSISTSMPGKWFAESGAHALEWGKRMEQGNGSVVSIRVPRDLADELFRLERLDGIGPARYVEPTMLDVFNQRHGGVRMWP